jgi:signal transduction histidine kinase
MQYDFASVNMSELVDSAIKELEPNIAKARLSIKFEKIGKGPFYITADYGKIRQVVMNIVDNSVKYTPKGSIDVRLEKDDDTHKVLLTVSDTGIGIPRESLHTLFQKFSRAPGAAAISTTGTGLGLYVVKEMMKAHKGNVWVDSPGVNMGSTFYLEFMGE